MALIKCANCNNEISDKAKVCPKCGYKLGDELNIKDANIEASPPQKDKIPSYIIVTLVCIFVIACVIGQINDMYYESESRSETKSEVTNSSHEAEEQIKENLTPKQKIVGSYHISQKDGYYKDYILTISEDGTCTMIDKKRETCIFRGYWEYSEYSNLYNVTWTSNDNPYENKSPIFTFSTNIIDPDIKYMYAYEGSYKAKDSNGRVELVKQ